VARSLCSSQWGRGGSAKNKVAMRLLVHPFICEIVMGILRNFTRQLRGARGGMPSLLLVSFLVVRSVYGRFLLVRAASHPPPCTSGSTHERFTCSTSSAPSAECRERHPAAGYDFFDGLHRAHVHQRHGCPVRFVAITPRPVSLTLTRPASQLREGPLRSTRIRSHPEHEKEQRPACV
jgi:hypothetical protein